MEDNATFFTLRNTIARKKQPIRICITKTSPMKTKFLSKAGIKKHKKNFSLRFIGYVKYIKNASVFLLVEVFCLSF